jgi:gamma-glutamyltranspeptidase/glutathione hydrolase
MMKNSARFLSFLILVWSCQSSNEKIVLAPDAVADSVMVASAHQSATQVGLDILHKGGNAFDAAIAVQFALAVVYPQAGNIGGGGFAVFRLGDGEIGSLDFREKAPINASKDMYLDSAQNVVSGLSTKGHLAVGVPGVIDGMIKLHEKHGTLPWRELVAPSVALASDGFVLKKEQASRINKYKDDFIAQNDFDLPLVKDVPWKKGDIIKLPTLSHTLQLIADSGRAGFYQGEVAAGILAEMRRGNGLISQEDLDGYEAKWRTPLTGMYHGHRIITMPPPSSGGVALLQLLQGSQGFDFANMEVDSPERIHAMTEIARRVYADRATYLGDPDYYDVPVDMLLDEAYNNERFSTIDMDAKTASSSIKEGNVEVIESTETTHFTIVDAQRNAISITTTVNGLFGCKVMVRGSGFFLNNEMDDFSAKPGVANQFGLVGAEANAIAPEKRMLSSMTPTIIEKDGELFMTVGTRGGSTIITSVYQTIINSIDKKMSMKEAVEAPRMHHQWQPDQIMLEQDRYDSLLIESLESLGHKIIYNRVLGKMRAIRVLDDGRLEGAADPIRSQGVVDGY